MVQSPPMTAPVAHAARPSILLAGTLAAVLTAHTGALGGPFVWDDRPLIVEDAAVHGEEGLRPLLGSFWRGSASLAEGGTYYRPATTVSYAFDWWRSGGDARSFHVTNVVLHLAATLLVALLAVRIGASPPAASLAALLFGVLPRLTESVSWISGRTDVLAAVFGLAGLAVHLGGRESISRRVAAAALALVAVLAKEAGLAAFAALAALELQRARLDGRWRRALRALAPAGVALFAYAALRALALHGAPAVPTAELSPGARALTALQTLGTLARMVVDPLRPRAAIGLVGHFEPISIALGGAFAAAVGLAACWARRERLAPETCAALAFAATPIVLVLHVVPISLHVVTADRFLYLPAAGLAVAAARWSPRLPPPGARAVAGVALTLATAFAWITLERGALWGDELRFWRTVVREAHPQNAVPNNELGNALYRHGLYEKALPHYERAATLGRGTFRATALANVSSTLSELGRIDEARAIARELVVAEPALAVNHYNLALIEARGLDFDAAERRLADAIARFPGYADARRALVVVRGVREAWSALPPESASEPTGLRAQRARVWAKLGVGARAAAQWEKVARAPDATAAQLREAAAWLATRGPPDAAEVALRRAVAAGAASEEEVRQLAGVLASRAAAARVDGS